MNKLQVMLKNQKDQTFPFPHTILVSGCVYHYEIVSPFSGEISSSFPFPVTREKNVITFDLSSYDGICSGTITFDEGEESSTFYFDVVEHISDQDLIGTYQSEKKKKHKISFYEDHTGEVVIKKLYPFIDSLKFTWEFEPDTRKIKIDVPRIMKEEEERAVFLSFEFDQEKQILIGKGFLEVLSPYDSVSYSLFSSEGEKTIVFRRTV